jgi:hypothetical protein
MTSLRITVDECAALSGLGPDEIWVGVTPSAFHESLHATLEDGRRLLTIGQKSGLVFALDPDGQGRIVWQARIERGGP